LSGEAPVVGRAGDPDLPRWAADLAGLEISQAVARADTHGFRAIVRRTDPARSCGDLGESDVARVVRVRPADLGTLELTVARESPAWSGGEDREDPGST
jgi:hypothetical protein